MRADASSSLKALWASITLAMRRVAFSKLIIPCLCLAAFPLVIAVLFVFTSKRVARIDDMHGFYQFALRTCYLHFAVFFSAAVIGFSVLRQDMEEKTLHYVLLQPVSRWMITAGRLIAFFLIVFALIALSQWIFYAVLVGHSARLAHMSPLQLVMSDLFVDGRYKLLLRESGVLGLGLVFYGAVAMLMATFCKTAMYAIVLFFWEAALPYLPSTLKFYTGMHYLQSMLTEMPGRQRLFEQLGSPATLGESLCVLLVTSAVLGMIATLIFQQRQCLYNET